MLTFKKAELSDTEALANALSEYKGRICDYSAGNIIFWRDYYDIAYSLDEDGLVLRYGNMGDSLCYSFPISQNPLKLVKKLLDASSDKTLCLTCLTEEELEIVKKNFTVTEIIYSRDWDDYIYSSIALISLVGRRFCGQRNHINKFKKIYPEHSFEIITKDNIDSAKDFCHRYFGGIGKETEVSDVEYKQLLEQLENWSSYHQMGGILKVGEIVVGLSVGEIVGDTLIVHTEKADTSFQGSYPMLTNSFAKQFATTDECKFINREEDCGEEGLRISKLSYHPTELIKKYAVVIK